jgi:hypothetical protein
VYWASWGVCWINPEFSRCSLFASWSSKGLKSTPSYMTCFRKHTFGFHQFAPLPIFGNRTRSISTAKSKTRHWKNSASLLKCHESHPQQCTRNATNESALIWILHQCHLLSILTTFFLIIHFKTNTTISFLVVQALVFHSIYRVMCMELTQITLTE